MDERGQSMRTPLRGHETRGDGGAVLAAVAVVLAVIGSACAASPAPLPRAALDESRAESANANPPESADPRASSANANPPGGSANPPAVATSMLAQPAGRAPGRVIDRGVFGLFIAGVRAGEEQFEIYDLGDRFAIRTRFELTHDTAVLVTESELVLDRSWRPVMGHTRQFDGKGLDIHVDLATVEDSLVQRTISSDRPPETVYATRKVDLYFGEASLSFGAPLCRAPFTRLDQVMLFPAVELPVTRVEIVEAPSEGDAPGSRRLSVAIVGQNTTNPLLVLCDRERIGLVWIPAMGLAAARPEFETVARDLVAKGMTSKLARRARPPQSTAGGSRSSSSAGEPARHDSRVL